MGDVINMQEFREKKAESLPEHKARRLAEIAFEILLLQSEKNQILSQLDQDPRLV